MEDNKIINGKVEDQALEEVTGGYQQGLYDFQKGDCFKNGVWYYKVLADYHQVGGSTSIKTEIYRSDYVSYGSSRYEAAEFDYMKFLGNNVF